jgi:Rrf2 family transcriptional regulator, iron-sulfur cluster assembly transcription factor
MKLSTKSRYSARIIIDLAIYSSGERPVQASEISRRQGIPIKYIEQLLRPLKTAGYVSSVRGAKGGYILSKNPKEISLGHIVRLFESQKDIVACIKNPAMCDMSMDCRIRMAWEQVNQAFYNSLESVTIDTLMQGTLSPCPGMNVNGSQKKKKSTG